MRLADCCTMRYMLEPFQLLLLSACNATFPFSTLMQPGQTCCCALPLSLNTAVPIRPDMPLSGS